MRAVTAKTKDDSKTEDKKKFSSNELEEMVRKVVGSYRKKDEVSEESCNRMTITVNEEENEHAQIERVRKKTTKETTEKYQVQLTK